MSVAVFFLLVHLCILHRVHTSTLCNCVLIYLLACLHFGFICVFECLPYFLQWFCALINCFFWTNYACLLLFGVCRFLSAPLARFLWIFIALMYFLSHNRLFMVVISRSVLLLRCFDFFADLFCSLRTVDFFACFVTVLHPKSFLVFLFFRLYCVFFCLHICSLN